MTVFASCADAIPAPSASSITSIIHLLLVIIPPAVLSRELICPDLGVARIIRQLAGWRIRCGLTAKRLFNHYLHYDCIATRYENGSIRRRLDWPIRTTIERRRCDRLYLRKAAN